MISMLSILENKKYVELKRMRKSIRKLVTSYKDDNVKYHKLMLVGLKELGDDSVPYMYKDMAELKQVNWRRLGSDLKDNRWKKYEMVMSSFEDYYPYDLEFKHEINKTVLDAVGNEMLIKNLIMRNSIFIIEETYNFAPLMRSLDLGDQMSFDDLALIAQLYDQLLDASRGFANFARKTIEHNAAISSKLDEDMSSFLVAEMI